VALPAQTLTTLHSFDVTNGGEYPSAGLVQGTDGNFYGTTEGGFGGPDSLGTVFKITPDGKLKTLHSFEGEEHGFFPVAGLVEGTDGNFYGTTRQGGAHDGGYQGGTVFKITASGTLTTLHSFDGRDGDYPSAGLVQATNGEFYGTTDQGGANHSNGGTIFKITPNGTLTTLHNFDGKDGSYAGQPLVQDINGKLYGTAGGGGAGGYGTVFSLSVGLK
jgi:uncharacterized repeat protein (TIGR03803 family)